MLTPRQLYSRYQLFCCTIHVVKGAVLLGMSLIHIPDVGQFLETPVGCVLVSAPGGIWMEKVDLFQKWRERQDYWVTKKSASVYFNSRTTSAHMLQENVGVFGTINPEDPTFVKLPNHNINRDDLIRHTLWCCHFPKTDVRVVGFNLPKPWIRTEEERKLEILRGLGTTPRICLPPPTPFTLEEITKIEEQERPQDESSSKNCLISWPVRTRSVRLQSTFQYLM